jgi:dihydroneopterin aldolase
MAQAIADLVLRFPLVAGVDVKVTKLRPPIAATVENTSVSITRTK